jgi:hypothetical protein
MEKKIGMQQEERNFITFPTWKKYIIISCFVEALRVKDKRNLFMIMRKYEHLDHDSYFPYYGITAGEFAIWQILCDNRKTRKNSENTKKQCGEGSVKIS